MMHDFAQNDFWLNIFANVFIIKSVEKIIDVENVQNVFYIYAQDLRYTWSFSHLRLCTCPTGLTES